MKRIKIIKHKKNKILFINLSDLDYEQIIITLKNAGEIISKRQKNSVLLLADVSNINFKDRKILSSINEFLLNNEKYFKSGAVIGLTGIYKTILKSFKNKIKINFSIFDNINDAQEWLVK